VGGASASRLTPRLDLIRWPLKASGRLSLCLTPYDNRLSGEGRKGEAGAFSCVCVCTRTGAGRVSTWAAASAPCEGVCAYGSGRPSVGRRGPCRGGFALGDEPELMGVSDGCERGCGCG
jgi:hypothetical protein